MGSEKSNITGSPHKVGDQQTSDVVVRLRTKDGRDEWLYCQSRSLTEQSKYFADRLSEKWPTCQILDSRNCVEVYCQESNFSDHVSVVRLLENVMNAVVDDLWNGVNHALRILCVAVELGCRNIVSGCVNYLEAIPWEENEEEEILKVVSHMGPEVEPILARLQPVNPSLVKKIFFSALELAASSPFSKKNDLKSSALEQLEYMLAFDEDDPLIEVDAEIKLQVNVCVGRLFKHFNNVIERVLDPLQLPLKARNMQVLIFCLSDLYWACRISKQLEILKEFVSNWIDASNEIVKVLEEESLASEIIQIRIKVLVVLEKVLEPFLLGTVILPTLKRVHMVKVWLPFVRTAKPLIDTLVSKDPKVKMDNGVWYSIESALVSVILGLPSEEQSEFINEWLQNQHTICYPDLSEVFEVWCQRSKVARRRLSLPLVGDSQGSTPTTIQPST